MGLASQIVMTFSNGVTIITTKGFESGDSFNFIPETIDITVSGVRKTTNEVYFPYKIGAPAKQTDLIAFATTKKYNLNRTESNAKVAIYTS